MLFNTLICIKRQSVLKTKFWSSFCVVASDRFYFYTVLNLILMTSVANIVIDALWSPEGKGLTSWLLFVMFIVIV